MSDMIDRDAAMKLRDTLADIIGAAPMSSIHSALSEYRKAIRALPAVEVGVKPLEWENVSTGYGPETYEAYAAMGFYQVFTDEDSCGAVFVEFATNRKQFGTTEARDIARVYGFMEAKAVAQADYAARIRSALAVTPAPDAGKVKALVEVLENILEIRAVWTDPHNDSDIKRARAAIAAMKEG